MHFFQLRNAGHHYKLQHLQLAGINLYWSMIVVFIGANPMLDPLAEAGTHFPSFSVEGCVT